MKECLYGYLERERERDSDRRSQPLILLYPFTPLTLLCVVFYQVSKLQPFIYELTRDIMKQSVPTICNNTMRNDVKRFTDFF